MKNRKLLIALSVLALCSCDPQAPSNSISNSESIGSMPSAVLPSDSTSDSISTKPVSIVFPGTSSGSSSNSTSSKPSLPPISSSEEDTRTKVSEADFIDAIASAYVKDEEYKSIGIRYYEMSSSQRSAYIKREYTMTSYSNDITMYSGVYTSSTGNSSQSSKYKEQLMYKDGDFTDIRKYDKTFRNYASKMAMEEQEAQYHLNISQSVSAYNAITTLSKKYDLTYSGYLEENQNKHVTYSYIGEADSNGYVLCALVEVDIDKDNYLTDFFYSEGYYDGYYASDGVEMLRKHGVMPLGSGGYSYEMFSPIKGNKEAYTDSLIFPLEDNFITDMHFNQEEITISLASIEPDAYGRKSIQLLDYITTNPTCGETQGCPINNLSFVSSNTSVATVGDQIYLDFSSVGETIITATDAANAVLSANSLKIIVTE